MALIDRDQMLSDLKAYLPEENALSDTLLRNIIDNVIDYQIPRGQKVPIDDDIYYSEDLCKSLKAAAQLNKAKFAVDDATIKRDKVDNVELERFEGASNYAWDDYIKSLSDICPYLPGGGFIPTTSIGARINPSPAFVIDTCACPDEMYF